MQSVTECAMATEASDKKCAAMYPTASHHQDFRSINCTISNRGYIPSVKLHCNGKEKRNQSIFSKTRWLPHPIYITFFSSPRSFHLLTQNSSIFVDEWTFNCCRSYWKKMLKRPTVTWRWWFGEGHVFKLCQSQNRLSEKKPICRINY